jgi:hypothetical protein
MMVLCCYVPPVVESIRANNAYSSPELARDINNMNIQLLKLERDSVQLRWDRDTIIVVPTLYRPTIVPSTNEDDTTVTFSPAPSVIPGYTRVDTAMFRERRDKSDSSVKLNDSMYVLFECPDYEFITSFGVNKEVPDSILHSVQLYKKVLEHYRRPDRKKVSAELNGLLNKYRFPSEYYSYYQQEDNGEDVYRRTFKSRISGRYHLYEINDRIYNIAYRKYRWDNLTVSLSARAFYYTTLILTLLVYVFRRSSVRTYFLTKLAALLITIFTSLFLVFASSDSQGVLTIILAYYAVFLIVAMLVSQSSVRSVFQGIAINLAVYCTPFMPLIVVSIYYDILRKQHRFEPDAERFFRHEFRDFQIAEIVGFALLLILLTFLFKRLYRIWYAQPEQ